MIDRTEQEKHRQTAIDGNEEKRRELEREKPAAGPGLSDAQHQERGRDLRWQTNGDGTYRERRS